MADVPSLTPSESSGATLDQSEMLVENNSEVAQFESILTCSDAGVMRESLMALDWVVFERFVRYLFECAGFTVEHVSSDHKRHHVDLRLYDGPVVKGKPIALVEIRHYHSALLKHQAVAAFIGNLVLAGAKRGYLVTTSAFTEPARSASQQAGQRGVSVCLTDWQHLARYLTYLRGSRITGADGRKRTPRPTPPDCLHEADVTPRRDPQQTRILAIANNRGGVAKTTSALSLALALVNKGRRVLLIDLDGQANLSLALPMRQQRGQPASPERTIVDFFAGRATLADLVRPTRKDYLWLLPGDGELYTRDRGGGADPQAELSFVRALHTLEIATGVPGAGRFDWIILDTPPAQSSYTRAALAASHVIMLPAIVEPFAVQSINRLLDTARTMQGLMGRDSRVLGSFAVRWPRRSGQQQRSQLSALQQGLLSREPPTTLFNTLIPEDAHIATANLRLIEGGVRGIFAYRGSAAARAYSDLLAELEGKLTT